MKTMSAPVSATVSVLAALGLGLSATPEAQAQAPTTTAAPLEWGACPETVTTPGAVCTTVQVLLDYAAPEGQKIDVMVSKLPARGQSRGVLFGNAGGPGGDSLTHFVDRGPFEYPAELRQEWDLIGVQPRGLPHATPLRCAPIDYTNTLMLVTNAGGALRSACEAGSPGYGRHLTTENTARDWEEVRRALGVDRISIHGLSYGTFLGSTYATLFPQHTDKLVLDSAMHPDWAWNDVLREQTDGYKSRMYELFDWIAAHDAEYHLGDTPLKVYQRWSEVIVEQAGVRPTFAPPPARVGDVPPALGSLAQSGADLATLTGPARAQAEGILDRLLRPGAEQTHAPLLLITRSVLPQKAAWPQLAAALRDGIPTGPPSTDASSMSEDAQIGQSMQATIMCNENQVPPRPLDYPGMLWHQLVTGDPFDSVGLAAGSGALCQGAPPVTRPVAVRNNGLSTRPLLLNTVGDPQTPLRGARVMAERMRAHVVTVGGGDHGVFAKKNPVADQAVLEYLRTGHTGVTEAPAPPEPAAK